jgi:hypothetical protein
MLVLYCRINAAELSNLSLSKGFGMFFGVAGSYTMNCLMHTFCFAAFAPLREIYLHAKPRRRKGEYGA